MCRREPFELKLQRSSRETFASPASLALLFQLVDLATDLFRFGPLLIALFSIHRRQVERFLHELAVLRLKLLFAVP